ncbi:hypothetical protein HK096_002024, partial [Nowakowskiella sp. JEL0078]
MTALIIPNAIAVSTTKSQYMFTSFISREQCFAVIDELWHNASTLEDFINQPPTSDINSDPESDSDADVDDGEDLYDSSFEDHVVVTNRIPVSLEGVTLIASSSIDTNSFIEQDLILVFLNKFISPLVAESNAATFVDAPLTWLTGITKLEGTGRKPIGRKRKIDGVQLQQLAVL